MTQLLAYLDSTGWKTMSPETRRLEKSGCIFNWKTGTAWADLWRWPKKRTAEYDIEIFILQNEDRCLELAKNINYGEYPPSIPPDPETGLRIAHL
jgi:hypothetical protein